MPYLRCLVKQTGIPPCRRQTLSTRAVGVPSACARRAQAAGPADAERFCCCHSVPRPWPAPTAGTLLARLQRLHHVFCRQRQAAFSVLTSDWHWRWQNLAAQGWSERGALSAWEGECSGLGVRGCKVRTDGDAKKGARGSGEELVRQTFRNRSDAIWVLKLRYFNGGRNATETAQKPWELAVFWI